MDTYNGILWIAGALVAVLIIGIFKNRTEWIINFILRGVLGMMMIYFINYFLSERVTGMEMGYNLLTFCASGFLGVPGILLLYGINLYMIL